MSRMEEMLELQDRAARFEKELNEAQAELEERKISLGTHRKDLRIDE